uniref:Uncharacterized protein n=1 Tax=Mustela putorius furo TaxID=9669 RepID=M3XV50_MUSPF
MTFKKQIVSLAHRLWEGSGGGGGEMRKRGRLSSAAAASARRTPAPPAARTAAPPPPRPPPCAASCTRRRAGWLSCGTPAAGRAPCCDLRPLQGQRRRITPSHGHATLAPERNGNSRDRNAGGRRVLQDVRAGRRGPTPAGRKRPSPGGAGTSEDSRCHRPSGGRTALTLRLPRADVLRFPAQQRSFR